MKTVDRVKEQIEKSGWDDDELARQIAGGYFGSDASYGKRVAEEILRQRRAAREERRRRKEHAWVRIAAWAAIGSFVVSAVILLRDLKL